MPQEPERIDIKLTYESLIAILQGKDFHLMHHGKQHFVFHPPFDGVFLTHRELADLERAAEDRIFRLGKMVGESLKVYEEKNR